MSCVLISSVMITKKNASQETNPVYWKYAKSKGIYGS